MMWDKERNGVRCNLCARKCFISKGKKGFCEVRKNVDNNLYTLNYGKLVAVNIDPIEKKPFFHFHPGTKALSIASAGCNFKCQFCDNWQISQAPFENGEIMGDDYTPEDIVKMADENDCKSIAYTYTEPTMFFEFVHDTAKMAKRSSIKNVLVTNGYMTEDALKKISKYLDAVVVDVKASLDRQFYKKFMSVPDVQPIYDTLEQIKRQRLFLEITNLIIPQIGDDVEKSKEFAQYINAELSPTTPLHMIRFTPSHKLMELPPTPVDTLERLVRDAQTTGLRYVYVGNVPGHEDEDTYCYNCRELLIDRNGPKIEEMNLIKNRCSNCGFRIDVEVE